MMRHVIIDTGPLVAAINRRDRYHDWAHSLLNQWHPPLLTCEAVITEACFLLRGSSGGGTAVLEMVERGILRPEFSLIDNLPSVKALIRKYRDVPISLADACLVRMCEIYDDCKLATCDGDFHVYRRHGRQTLPLIMPA